MTKWRLLSGKRLKANRTYKSSVFASYFSETRQRLIELYNAFSTVEYPADTPLKINTLKNALYYTQINDVSFVLDNKLIIMIEHQSTFNPNMPFRILIYIAEILKRRYRDPEPFYKSKLQQIEGIRCFVLYNGSEERPDKEILRLSDAYKKVFNDVSDPGLDIQLELIVPVYNINLGKNPDILARSNALNEYSQFIAKVNEGLAAGMDLTQAIEAAIKYCLEHNIMAEYLRTHETEVHIMLFKEMTATDIAEVRYSEGIEQGIEQGIISVARELLSTNLTIDEIARVTGLTRDEVDHLRMMQS